MFEIDKDTLAELVEKAIDAGFDEFYIPVKLVIDNENESMYAAVGEPIQKIHDACGLECPNLKPAAITINGMPIKPADLALRLQG